MVKHLLLEKRFLVFWDTAFSSSGFEWCEIMKRPCPSAFPPEATMPEGAFYGQEGAFWEQEGAFYGQEATMPVRCVLWSRRSRLSCR